MQPCVPEILPDFSSMQAQPTPRLRCFRPQKPFIISVTMPRSLVGDWPDCPNDKRNKQPFQNVSLESPVPADFPIDIMFGDTLRVTLIVGPEQKPLFATEKLLRYIPYFENCFRHDFEESRTSQFRLPDECPIAVQTALTWLVKGLQLGVKMVHSDEVKNIVYDVGCWNEGSAAEFFDRIGGAALFALADKWGARGLEMAACKLTFYALKRECLANYSDKSLLHVYEALRNTRHRYLPLEVMERSTLFEWFIDDLEGFATWNDEKLNCVKDFWQDLFKLQGVQKLLRLSDIGESDLLIDSIAANDPTSPDLRKVWSLLDI